MKAEAGLGLVAREPPEPPDAGTVTAGSWGLQGERDPASLDFGRLASRGVRAETAVVSSPKCVVIRGSGHRTVTQETKMKTCEGRTSA